MSGGGLVEVLRRLAEAATPGPWHVCDSPEWNEDALPDQVICDDEHTTVASLADEWYEDEDGEPASADDARYIAAANPAAILGLLDRLVVAERKVAACQAILDARDAWDGSPGPDGRIHPDSSPHDRDRLRDALAGGHEHEWLVEPRRICERDFTEVCAKCGERRAVEGAQEATGADLSDEGHASGNHHEGGRLSGPENGSGA